MSSVLAKFGVRDRTRAVLRALEVGLLLTPDRPRLPGKAGLTRTTWTPESLSNSSVRGTYQVDYLYPPIEPCLSVDSNHRVYLKESGSPKGNRPGGSAPESAQQTPTSEAARV